MDLEELADIYKNEPEVGHEIVTLHLREALKDTIRNLTYTIVAHCGFPYPRARIEERPEDSSQRVFEITSNIDHCRRELNFNVDAFLKDGKPIQFSGKILNSDVFALVQLDSSLPKGSYEIRGKMGRTNFTSWVPDKVITTKFEVK